MAAATAAAIGRWPAHDTLLICDDRPARWREIFTFIAEQVGAQTPATGGRLGFPSFRARNRRAREALGWGPHYADFRAGLVR